MAAEKRLNDETFSGTAPVTTGTNTVAIAATDVSGNTATKSYQVNVSGSSATLTYERCTTGSIRSGRGIGSAAGPTSRTTRRASSWPSAIRSDASSRGIGLRPGP